MGLGVKVYPLWGSVVAGLGLLLASCGSQADADEPESVQEGSGEAVGSDGADQSDGDEGDDGNGGGDGEAAQPDDEEDAESEGTGDDGNADDDDDAEPVPASSDGPAENWPVPEPPDEIYEPTQEGAEALIQHWFDARHYARITGDTEPLEYVSLEGCEVCSADLGRIESHYPGGWFVEESANGVVDAFVRLDTDTASSGAFVLEEMPFQVYADGGQESSREFEELLGFIYDFRYEDDRWQALAFASLGEWDPDRRVSAEDLEEAEQSQ